MMHIGRTNVYFSTLIFHWSDYQFTIYTVLFIRIIFWVHSENIDLISTMYIFSLQLNSDNALS